MTKAWMTSFLVALPAMAGAEELDIWIRASNDSLAVYEALAKDFTEKTGITVKYFNALTDFEQRIARAAAGRDLPDLVFNDATAMGQMLKMGILEEVDRDGIAGADDLLPVAWDSARAFDGKYYAVPTSAQSFALFVRKDWREKLGLPQPETWEDVAAMAKAFTESDPDGNGKADTFGFTLPASATRGYTSWFLSNYIWQAGGDFLNKEGDRFTSALDSDEVAKAVGFIRDLACANVTQPGAINATTADAIPSFRSGQTGMFLSGPYHIALFDKEPGSEVVEVVKPPAGPGGVASLAEGTSVYFTKGSDRGAAAKTFVEYMISPEAQTLGMAIDTANQPVVRLPVNGKVDMAALRDDSRWTTFAEVYRDNGHYVPGIPNWTPVRQITSDHFNAVLADCSADIRAGLKAADTAVNAELRSQGVLAE